MSLNLSSDSSRSSSPALPADVINDDGDVVWFVRGRGRIGLNVPPEVGSPIVTQSQYLEQYAPVERPYRIVHCSFIKNKDGGRRCGFVRPEFLLDEIRQGLISPWEELLLPGRPTKKFFDIEKKLDLIVRDEDVEDYVNDLIAHLHALCEWSSARDDYAVMRCQYPSDPTKLSLHIVLNDRRHFATPKYQLDFMEKKGVDFETYGIDKNVYSNSVKRLRGVGGCKWTEVGLSPPFYLIGKLNISFTADDLDRCLAQYVPSDSEVDRLSDGVESHRQRLIEIGRQRLLNGPPRGNFDPVPETPSTTATFRDMSRRLMCDIEILRRDAFRYKTTKEGRLLRCQFWLPGRYFRADAEVLVKIDPQCHVYQISCPTQRNFHAFECGYEIESDEYLRQEAYLKFLISHKLARVDFPIYDIFAPGVQELPNLATVGRFGYDSYEFFKELRDTIKLCRQQRKVRIPCRGCDWCTSDSQMANDVIPSCVCSFAFSGQLLDVNFFNFLRDRQSSAMSSECAQTLLGYVELFVGFSVSAETWIVRTNDGLSGINQNNLKDHYFGALHYFIEKVSGRGDDRIYTWVAKPFWKYAIENQNHMKYERVASGRFCMGPDYPLNFSKPLGIDVNFCLRAWRELKDRDRAQAMQLQNIWRLYAGLAVWNERTDKFPLSDVDAQNHHRDAVADQLLRWVCEVIFKFGVRTSVMPVFVSQGGGQGKSTLGNIICHAVGPKNFSTADAKTALGRFNDAYNGFCFFDEIHVNKETAEALKSAVTTPTIRLEAKFRKPVQVQNCRNFFSTSNNVNKLEFINASKERRSMVLVFPEIQAICDDGVISYMCRCCEKHPDEFGYAYCQHDILNHAEFLTQVYTKVLRQTQQGDERGEFFIEFIGMFFELYRFCVANKIWTGSLQQQLIVTAGTRELQVQSDTRAARWLDSCLETGFHWSPVIAPGQNAARISHRTADIERLGNHETAPVWELKVTREALYAHFRDWCVRNGESVQRADEFFSDLKYLSQQRRGRTLETVIEKGCSLEWVKERNTDKGQWIRQTDADQDVVVILMGCLRSSVPSDEYERQITTSRQVIEALAALKRWSSASAENEAALSRNPQHYRTVQALARYVAALDLHFSDPTANKFAVSREEWARKQLAGSTVVRAPALNRSNSSLPPTQMEEHIPAAIPAPNLDRDSTRAFALRVNDEHPSPARAVGVFEAIARLNDEDAQQPLFIPHGVRRARDEVVDEAQQDARAALEDLQNDRRVRSRFEDDEAQENDEIEQEDEELEDPHGHHISLSLSE